MKKFFISVLIGLVSTTGISCTYFLFALPGIHMYHIPLMIGSMLIFSPAITYWENYFKELFKDKDGSTKN